ncbi:hypothetical protein D9M70_612490 [compost metagenome]
MSTHAPNFEAQRHVRTLSTSSASEIWEVVRPLATLAKCQKAMAAIRAPATV